MENVNINDKAKLIYECCKWRDNISKGEKTNGDQTVFDSEKLMKYDEQICNILDDIDIPQGISAIGNPIVELGLAIGELECETMPSLWYSDAPYGEPSIIKRTDRHYDMQEKSIEDNHYLGLKSANKSKILSFVMLPVTAIAIGVTLFTGAKALKNKDMNDSQTINQEALVSSNAVAGFLSIGAGVCSITYYLIYLIEKGCADITYTIEKELGIARKKTRKN